MNISILNGNPDPGNTAFEQYLDELVERLGAEHSVRRFDLREMDIHYCSGCLGCWVKTPGECVTKDESADVRRSVIHSDFMLLASPLIMGFPSALLKKMVDKIIPLIHPYFVVVQGEAHHRARYDRYPLVGLLLQRENDTDETDIRLITDIFSRTSLNFISRLSFTRLTDQPVEEVAHAFAA